MAGKDGNSEYHAVHGSGKKSYNVTINYGQGHWCNCRGMISKKSRWGDDAGKTQGTSCKHILNIINTKYNGDCTMGIGAVRTEMVLDLPRPL
jgi:hypothetical protein